MLEHAEDEINGTSIKEWVFLDSPEITYAAYMKAMKRRDEWAGHVEMQVLANIRNIRFLMYRLSDNGYILKSTINPKIQNGDTVTVRLHHQLDRHFEVLHLTTRGKQKLNIPYVLAVNEESPLYDSDSDSDVEDELEIVKLKALVMREFEAETMTERTAIYDDVILTAITEKFNLTTLESKNPIRQLRMKYGNDLVDQAIKEELTQMIDQTVWKFLTPKQAQKVVYDELQKTPLPMQMLVKEKFDAAGVLIKLKARLVVLGNLQTNDVFIDVSAPTASMHSVYFIIMLAAKCGIKLRTSDVKGAFLNALMQEREFVRLNREMTDIMILINPTLREFVAQNGTMIAELLKCLYGLRQSPLRWFETMTALLLILGFSQSIHDQCFFYKITTTAKGKSKNYLVLYVDDMLLAFESTNEYDTLIKAMTERFGDISTNESNQLSFLGLNINSSYGSTKTKSAEHITVDQKGYLEKLLNSIVDFDYAKVKYPCRSDFTVNDERFRTPRIQADPVLAKIMKSLTMKIMFAATRTRKDILFLTSFLASINCPTQEDIDAAKQIIAFMYNTREAKQIFYKLDGKIELIMFGDASFKAFADGSGQNCQVIYPDRHSAPIRFSSKRQHKKSLSAAQSEATAQVELVKMGEILYSRLSEIQEITPTPFAWCDNMATVNQSKEKHLNTTGNSSYYILYLHFLNEAVKENRVTIEWITTKEMDADLGTKPLYGKDFLNLAKRTFYR